MEHRTLGRTGLTVSRLGFGGAPIGIDNYLTRDDRDSAAFHAAAIAAIREAVARGVTYFDTAPAYGDGRSERLLGEALEPHRDRVAIATKYGFWDWRSGPEAKTERLKESLQRLRTDHVNVLQLHGNTWDDASAEEVLTCGILDWVDSMRDQGLCRCTGITAEGPSGALERLLRSGRFDVVEIAYNVIYQSACDYQRSPVSGIVPLAKSLGMGVTVMRPTTCGVLQKLLAAEFPEIDRDRLTRMAINFVLSTPEVDCAVVGMRNVEEVKANAELVEDLNGRLDLTYLHDRFC
jgi:aryl-alcohol dehydrogenase-like predicted oxidoreductase